MKEVAYRMCCVLNKIVSNNSKVRFSGRRFSVFVKQKLKDAALPWLDRCLLRLFPFTYALSTDGEVLFCLRM